MRADPNDLESLYNLGLALKNFRRLSGAIEAFQRAIALKPDFEKARYNLGIVLRARGEHADADRELAAMRDLHEFRRKLAESQSAAFRAGSRR